MVLKAKEYIAAGDAFQIVPSQRFETDFAGTPVDLYRALRHIQSLPYMFILELDDFLTRRQLSRSTRPGHRRAHRHSPHRRNPLEGQNPRRR